MGAKAGRKARLASCALGQKGKYKFWSETIIYIFVELVWGVDMALGMCDWHYDEVRIAGGWNFGRNWR